MKRLGTSSDSLAGLMSFSPSSTDDPLPHSPGINNNGVYTREFRSMMMDGLDEDGCLDDQSSGGGGGVHIPEKKRRLSLEQVKALEKNFEVENKLEPERKVKLAQELGLQPRQVAVWFQNRRARWKTKQLERDYGVLKANYDSLKLNFDELKQDNEDLLKQIRELKSKVNIEDQDHAAMVEEESNKDEETMGSESEEPLIESQPSMAAAAAGDESDRYHFLHHHNPQLMSVDFFAKDGPSDSDSSAILNDENNSPNEFDHLLFGQQLRFNCSSSSTSPPPNCYFNQQSTTTTFVKMEEHDFFSEEACNFYAEDHAPTLHNLYTAAANASTDHQQQHHWT